MLFAAVSSTWPARNGKNRLMISPSILIQKVSVHFFRLVYFLKTSFICDWTVRQMELCIIIIIIIIIMGIYVALFPRLKALYNTFVGDLARLLYIGANCSHAVYNVLL